MLTPSHAIALMKVIETTQIRDLITMHALDAVNELYKLSQNGKVAVYILYNVNKKVDAIKLARAVSGMGLKDAKDFVDSQDQHVHAPEAWIGPVPGVTDIETAKARLVDSYGEGSYIARHVEFRPAA
jgi:hypothetical protein